MLDSSGMEGTHRANLKRLSLKFVLLLLIPALWLLSGEGFFSPPKLNIVLFFLCIYYTYECGGPTNGWRSPVNDSGENPTAPIRSRPTDILANK